MQLNNESWIVDKLTISQNQVSVLSMLRDEARTGELKCMVFAGIDDNNEITYGAAGIWRNDMDLRRAIAELVSRLNET